MARLLMGRFVGTLLLFVGCQGPVPALSPPAPSAASPVKSGVLDGIFDAGGVSLHIHCAGEGIPAVIFDSGAGSDGTTWDAVMPGVQSFTRACVYDHAGSGYSGPAGKPHTSQQMAGELHALLTAAGVRVPYVLVGHSFGGLNARMFESQYPAEVVGLVLIDASTEWLVRMWSRLLSPEMTRLVEESLRDRRDGINREAFLESAEQVRTASRSLGTMPLVVLTHGVPFSPDPGMSVDVAASIERDLQEQQVWLASLSSNSVHVVATKSGHFVQRQNPKLVIAGVRQTVEAVRTHGSLAREPLDALADATEQQ
jgi:pimeloyl-ACP methyl ester carboxylesterase